MVRTEFALPDVGEGVAEGELVAWLVEPGDRVAEDQPIAEVETDKALVEIPSAYDGVVEELRAAEGETIPVGETFVVFDVDEADAPSDTGASESETAGDRADSTAPPGDGDAGTGRTDQPDQTDQDEAIPNGRVFAPPSVRRLARELGVDLAAVQEADPGSRLSERDVRDAAGEAAATETESDAETPSESASIGAVGPESGTVEAESASIETDAVSVESPDLGCGSNSAESRPQAAAGRDRTLAMPATRRLTREEGVDVDDVPASERRDGQPYVTPEDVRSYAAGSAGAPPASSAPGPESAVLAAEGSQAAAETATESRGSTGADQADGPRPGDRIPYAGVRRTIGEQMATSKYTAPHVSHHDEVEVSELVDARSRLKERAEERGVKLTYLPFAVKAVVAALKEVPAINGELDEEREEIVLHDEYNIGIAVATDAGLMVPVIENADRKGLLELAREIDNKAARARDRSIGLDELQGGTFTITNIGAIGGEYASPIINHPEAGILALGSLKERPWAEDGELLARPTLPISMSVDHRIVDGAEAARFTNEVKRYLNEPELLLLE
ncbi:dihydrolipoamide acetyltransferase family protein [Natrinema salifodinae]|uniref:Pyruvate dehydrogenase E2 component (Dihydrolipoamide acetyltransferase) n=1 Tax=Natrinema salifodinae TaxID=1202768 RepID=A0A1I0LYX2_9EURY|nr:dihydrolipoamide acetyltransferase family protein [Natrinema salifodinae]SEV80446.1 pyruvate dehydrogenase E2 component (dihydrolipoamide acetyltransferase) [Natrinema salifodinae]